MIITDAARDEILLMFKEENANNIRIFFAGYG